MGWGETSAADGLVIAMLIAMFLALGVVALLFLTIRKNARRRDIELNDLLDEVGAEDSGPEKPPEKTREAKVAAEPWERDGDWWKS